MDTSALTKLISISSDGLCSGPPVIFSPCGSTIYRLKGQIWKIWYRPRFSRMRVLPFQTLFAQFCYAPWLNTVGPESRRQPSPSQRCFVRSGSFDWNCRIVAHVTGSVWARVTETRTALWLVARHIPRTESCRCGTSTLRSLSRWATNDSTFQSCLLSLNLDSVD